MWYRLPEVTSPNALLQTIELELAKARAEGYGTLLEGIDQWSKRFQDYFAQVHFGSHNLLDNSESCPSCVFNRADDLCKGQRDGRAVDAGREG